MRTFTYFSKLWAFFACCIFLPLATTPLFAQVTYSVTSILPKCSDFNPYGDGIQLRNVVINGNQGTFQVYKKTGYSCDNSLNTTTNFVGGTLYLRTDSQTNSVGQVPISYPSQTEVVELPITFNHVGDRTYYITNTPVGGTFTISITIRASSPNVGIQNQLNLPPQSSIQTGGSVSAQFTLKNTGTASATVPRVTVGIRKNGFPNRL